MVNNAAARAKIVRLINYCGGTGSNILGCSWVGGNGMVMVRFGNVADEAALWAHEYGHNAGFGHDTDSRTSCTAACAAAPWASLRRSAASTGRPPRYPDRDDHVGPAPMATTTRSRPDRQCPAVANNNQIDADGDGVGDAATRARPPTADAGLDPEPRSHRNADSTPTPTPVRRRHGPRRNARHNAEDSRPETRTPDHDADGDAPVGGHRRRWRHPAAERRSADDALGFGSRGTPLLQGAVDPGAATARRGR